jgi:hypothetical protein
VAKFINEDNEDITDRRDKDTLNLKKQKKIASSDLATMVQNYYH